MHFTELNVERMTCSSCVRHVTEALNTVAGVVSVEVDLEKASVRIKGQADSEALINALDEAGYPSTTVNAAKPTHDSHTTCCGGCQ